MRPLLSTSTLLLLSSVACCSGPCWDPDDDDDGWEDSVDCEDDSPLVFPGAPEYCDGLDNDCDDLVDEDAQDAPYVYYVDADVDGHGDPTTAASSCQADTWGVSIGDDCDDEDARVHPEADEICDTVDNDCDGAVDEDVTTAPTGWLDADGDGWGDPEESVRGCEARSGYVENALDCDDEDPSVHPDAPERCGNGQDDDCTSVTPDACGYDLVDLSGVDAMILALGDDARLGFSVAGAGDVDDDGFDDALLGAPGASPSEGAWLVRGPVAGTTTLEYADAHLTAGGNGAEAGFAVAGADLDGDGFSDPVLGAPADAMDADTPGAAWLFYGPDVADCAPWCDGATLFGEATGDRAGTALATGDVDGDRRADLLVGAPAHGGRGAAYLLTPGSGDLSLSTARLKVTGDLAHGAAGTALGTGDLDADGVDEILVLDTAVSDGSVYAVPYVSDGTLSLGDAPTRVHGADRTPLTSFSARGDLDDDGAIDLVVGLTPDFDEACTRVGAVFRGPLSGEVQLEDALVLLDSEYTWANAGLEPVTGGDLDADGVQDLVLAARSAEVLAAPDFDRRTSYPGAVFLVAGPLEPGTLGLGEATVRFATDDGGDLDRVTAAFAGDLDRDGWDDLLIGAWQVDDGGASAGAVWVVGGGR